jgi:hypothetical protein
MKDLLIILLSIEDFSIDLNQIYELILLNYDKLSCKIIYTLFLYNLLNIEIYVKLKYRSRSIFYLKDSYVSTTFKEIVNDFIKYDKETCEKNNLIPLTNNKLLNTIISCCNFNKYKYIWILLVIL